MAMTFLDALIEVTSDTILVDRSPAGAMREARTNLWMFAMTQEQARETATAQVEQFVRAVLEARSREIVTRHGGHAMSFYCWCDEQAAQLRFGLVSVLHGRLPFDCPIIPASDLRTIVVRFLDLPDHDGIPLDGGMPPGVVNNGRSATETADSAQQPLAVWIRQLPLQPELLLE